jgi:hypothetical protein
MAESIGNRFLHNQVHVMCRLGRQTHGLFAAMNIEDDATGGAATEGGDALFEQCLQAGMGAAACRRGRPRPEHTEGIAQLADAFPDNLLQGLDPPPDDWIAAACQERSQFQIEIDEVLENAIVKLPREGQLRIRAGGAIRLPLQGHPRRVERYWLGRFVCARCSRQADGLDHAASSAHDIAVACLMATTYS